jgi:hypothetical protein
MTAKVSYCHDQNSFPFRLARIQMHLTEAQKKARFSRAAMGKRRSEGRKSRSSKRQRPSPPGTISAS